MALALSHSPRRVEIECLCASQNEEHKYKRNKQIQHRMNTLVMNSNTTGAITKYITHTKYIAEKNTLQSRTKYNVSYHKREK